MMKHSTKSIYYEFAPENTNTNNHTGFEVVTENSKPKLLLNSMDESLVSAPIRYAVADTAVRFKQLSPKSTKTEIDSRQMYLSEEILRYETWQGHVIYVSEDNIEMEVRNDKFHEIKRTLRVPKGAVRNPECAYVGNKAYVSFKEVRNYEGRIKEHTTVALNRSVVIPSEVKELRYKEKMQKYAFMFNKDDK